MNLREAWRLGEGMGGLEVGLLLAEAAGLGWEEIFRLPERPLGFEEERRFRELIARRREGWPVAYLRGEKEFYGLSFRVGPAVLIPRPETELLVEVALKRGAHVGRLVEIGVGSGAVILTLARMRPDWECLGTDISPEALDLARINAARHGLSGRVRLLLGDLGAPLREEAFRADLLIMNPPYLKSDEVPPPGPGSEPAVALDGGADGLRFYRRLAWEAPTLLRPGGRLLVEVGAGQSEAVAEIFREELGGRTEGFSDLAGHTRALFWEER